VYIGELSYSVLEEQPSFSAIIPCVGLPPPLSGEDGGVDPH
jgi:hypothetical protein